MGIMMNERCECGGWFHDGGRCDRCGESLGFTIFSTKGGFNLPPLSLTLRIIVPIIIILALTVRTLV